MRAERAHREQEERLVGRGGGLGAVGRGAGRAGSADGGRRVARVVRALRVVGQEEGARVGRVAQVGLVGRVGRVQSVCRVGRRRIQHRHCGAPRPAREAVGDEVKQSGMNRRCEGRDGAGELEQCVGERRRKGEREEGRQQRLK
eukprot:4207717-Pleurochrysis_carterae.AAC.1